MHGGSYSPGWITSGMSTDAILIIRPKCQTVSHVTSSHQAKSMVCSQKALRAGHCHHQPLYAKQITINNVVSSFPYCSLSFLLKKDYLPRSLSLESCCFLSLQIQTPDYVMIRFNRYSAIYLSMPIKNSSSIPARKTA